MGQKYPRHDWVSFGALIGNNLNNVNMCKFYESPILFQILKIFVETFLPVWLLNLLAGHKYLVLAELLKRKKLERFFFVQIFENMF